MKKNNSRGISKVVLANIIVVGFIATFFVRTQVFAAVLPTDSALLSYTNIELISIIQKASGILATRFIATPTPTPAPAAVRIEAWVYPGAPSCNAVAEIKSRKVHTIKAEYLTLDATGNVVTRTESINGCNGYSTANASLIKANSQEQFVTISGNRSSMAAMYANTTKRAAFVKTATAFVNNLGFTGVDIDFEEFGRWSVSDYNAFKSVVTLLGNSLHASGKKLLVNLPPIGNATMQNYYVMKYEDLNALPIDEFTIMAYDYHYDYGAGTPVQPLSWLNSIVDWSLTKFADATKITIGIPNYGYQGVTGLYNPTTLTYEQIQNKPGFATAKRDSSSQEMTWSNAGITYFYSDTTTLNAKIAAIKAKGITKVSVWHLGGNQWFSGY